MDATPSKQLLVQKAADLMILQRENQNIQAIISMIRNQLALLKTEEVALKNCIIERENQEMAQTPGSFCPEQNVPVSPTELNPYELYQLEKTKHQQQNSQNNSSNWISENPQELICFDFNLGGLLDAGDSLPFGEVMSLSPVNELEEDEVCLE